ncbi:ATP-binding SpoIIE family protein phosphatase [Parathalassolituus penaei]|uniref:Fused response regulator/phosphatase n=1 Tax=Parathalassolituus penaei TaxID=2997323 RepID=A0A9X3IS78_9GAMM|nr:fused response regulator/phosphatase [Parathalassolituus penaei]MCY0966052.1 fused response regulator/phosphatase [Parathalassolituus penaei]
MTGIRVLIADDNLVDRKLLSRIVRNQGNTVVEATCGEEAILAFREHHPDIVLMDVLMPGIGGKEAARCIKAEAGEDMVPIIFLTSLTDAHDLAACLESGGDDFMNKPYNPVVLEAKIRSFYRMRDMHRTLQAQRDTIAVHNDHLIREQETAKAVFDNVAHHGCLSSPNIRYMLSPLAVFNGDVLLAARCPGGGMHVLLGDFTGHGLPAAIGAMPMAEIFYGMTAKGFGIRDIVREINLKLHNILPVGFFCCATMAALDFDNKTTSLWMGGVPDGYLLRSKNRELEPLCSTHLPLGVLSNARFNDSVIDLNFNNDDRLFFWSDGILEARNSAGEMFGQERLEHVMRYSISPTLVFEDIQTALSEFQGTQKNDDDVTLLEVVMMDRELLGETPVGPANAPASGPLDWSLSYRLGPQSLQTFNPLPLMMHIIMEVPGLQSINGQLYSVLSELYSNALEHGVLGLDSSLKHSPEGFMRYYQERETRLQQMGNGHVIIEMEHSGNVEHGRLVLRFRDSGPGFDWQTMVNRSRCTPGDAHRYCGRGIPLLSSICTSLEYKEKGNVVEAEIMWPPTAEG